MIDIEYDNEKINAWADKNLNDIKSEIDALDIKHYPYSPNKKSLKNSITKKIRMQNGIIDKISFGMPRSAVFLSKGVSKGHPVSNPRTAKRFYDIPTDANMPELQQIVADADCTWIINNLTIK